MANCSQISGAPVVTGAHPFAGAVDYSGKFLYVVNQNDNNISGCVIDQITGALTPVPRQGSRPGRFRVRWS